MVPSPLLRFSAKKATMSSAVFRRLYVVLSASRSASTKAAGASAKQQEYLESLAQSLKRSYKEFRSRPGVSKEAVRRLASTGHFSIIEDVLEDQKQHIQSLDEHFATYLMRLYSVAGMFDHARKLFDEMPGLNCAHTIRSLNCLLQACIESKRFDEVEPLSRDLLVKLSLKPNLVTYNTLISAYCRIGSVDSALSVIDEISEKGLEPDCITFGPLLVFFYRSGRFEEGDRIWDLMESKGVYPNATAFHIRLQAMISHDKLADAVQLFDDMEKKNMQLDTYCYNALIFAFRKKGDAEETKRWYRRLVKSNCSPNFMTMSRLIPFFHKKGDLEMAYELCADGMNKNMHFRLSSEMVQSVVDDLVRQSKVDLADKLVCLSSSASKSRYNLRMPSEN